MSGVGPDVCVVGQIARDLVLVVGEVPGPGAAPRSARRTRRCGSAPTSSGAARRLVALAVEGANVFVWEGGRAVVPLDETPVADTTGAGDALTAALIAALARGEPPECAARFSVAAAGATVGHPGGRPALSFEGVGARAGL